MSTVREHLTEMWRSRKLFFFFLGSYIPILAVLLVFSVLAYTGAVRQMDDNVRKLNLGLMEHISTVIDQRLLEIERTSHRLTSLTSTSKLAYLEEDNDDFYYEMTKYVQNLWPMWLENDKLTPRFYVYFDRAKILAAPDTFYKADEFYGQFLKYGELDAGSFFDMLLEPENNFRYFSPENISLKDQPDLQGQHDMILYNYQLRRTGIEIPGTIFFLIDIQKIREMLEVLEIGEGGIAAILRSDGEVVVSLDNDSGISDEQLREIAAGEEIEIKDRMAITVLSDQKGWKYLALGNHDVLMKPVLVLKQMMIVLIAASLIFAVAFSLIMARKRSRPLADIICRLNDLNVSNDNRQSLQKENDSKGNELWGTGYKSLEYSIDSIVQRNTNMRQKLQTVHPMIMSAFLNQLFRGVYSDDTEVSAEAAHLDLTLPEGPFRLVFFALGVQEIQGDNLKQNVIRTVSANAALLDCLEKTAGRELLMYQISMDRVVWIQNSSNAGDENEMLDLLNGIAFCMKDKGFTVSIRFSRLFDAISDCWWEYEQLKHSVTVGNLQRDGKSGVELAWHDPDPEKNQYMLLVAPIMASMFGAGDERMIGRLFDIVKKEIFNSAYIDDDSRRILITQLAQTVTELTGVGIGEHIGTPDVAFKTDDDRDERFFEMIKEHIIEACQNSVRERSESGSFLIRKICDYTDSQLFNPGLSMTLIADKMNISENYLSRIFKEQYGETLSVYIETKRIEKAKEYLSETMMSISDISVKTGYNSDHVFRRAFRRVTGLSPVEFRQGQI